VIKKWLNFAVKKLKVVHHLDIFFQKRGNKENFQALQNGDLLSINKKCIQNKIFFLVKKKRLKIQMYHFFLPKLEKVDLITSSNLKFEKVTLFFLYAN
jgi:hypothetical protein